MRKFSGVVVFFLLCLLTACGNATATTEAVTTVATVNMTPTTTTAAATTTIMAAATTTSTTTSSTLTTTSTPVVVTTTGATVLVVAPTALPTLSLVTNNSMLKQTRQIGDLLIQLVVVPGSDNENLIDVTLFDTTLNQPINTAALVQVQSNSTEMDMGLQTLNLKPNGKAGVYESNDLHFTMFGNWKLDLLVKLPNKNDVKTSFEFNIVQ